MSFKWFTELGEKLHGVGTGPVLEPHLHNAYRLLHHPRNASVCRSGGYMLVGTGQRLDGLTDPLRDTFYPRRRVVSTGGAKTGGSARGTTADREIAGLVNKAQMPKSGAFSPYALRILHFIRRHGLQPFAAQFIVYDTDLRIATEIDLVCIDTMGSAAAEGRIVFVECKTGFDRNYDLQTGRFASPFVRDSRLTLIPMTYRNAHQLQALAQFIIARKNYGNLVHRAVVAVFTSSEDALYKISPEIEAVRYDVFCNLRARLASSEDETQRRGAAAAAKDSVMKSLFT